MAPQHMGRSFRPARRQRLAAPLPEAPGPRDACAREASPLLIPLVALVCLLGWCFLVDALVADATTPMLRTPALPAVVVSQPRRAAQPRPARPPRRRATRGARLPGVSLALVIVACSPSPAPLTGHLQPMDGKPTPAPLQSSLVPTHVERTVAP